MLRHAIWVLEQQYQWYQSDSRKRLWTHRRFQLGDEDTPPWLPLTIMVGATAQTALISGFPYIGLAKAAGAAEHYVWERSAPQHMIKGFKFGPGIKGFQPFGWSTSRKAMLRLGAAKMASRFIPYVGWGLFAYDLYSVGKWGYGKIKD